MMWEATEASTVLLMMLLFIKHVTKRFKRAQLYGSLTPSEVLRGLCQGGLEAG